MEALVHYQRHGHNMISKEDKKEILNGKIDRLVFLIDEIEPFKDLAPEGKPSNQSILDEYLSKKNTYSQLLAEL